MPKSTREKRKEKVRYGSPVRVSATADSVLDKINEKTKVAKVIHIENAVLLYAKANHPEVLAELNIEA